MIYLELFYTFFFIGLFTIGGGYAMIPMISDQVISKGWLDMNQLVDFIAISESTPGPFAVNISTFVGNQVGGLLGAAIATLAVVLPSFIIILVIVKFFYSRFVSHPTVQGALYGLRPAVLGLIGGATFSVLLSALFGGLSLPAPIADVAAAFNPVTCGILVVLLGLNWWKKLHPIALVGIAAAMGIGVHLVIGG